jgi:hypothetical protein
MNINNPLLLSDYLFEKNNSITDEVCDDLIKYYNESETFPGKVLSGINKNIKDTDDLCIPITTDNESKWFKVIKLLKNEITQSLSEYFSKITHKHFNNVENDNYEYYSNTKSVTISTFMIQRYIQNKGKYIYHTDDHFDNSMYRILTFIWYLNDVTEGGETEFWGQHTVIPTKGKLLLFPATWTFPHRGKMSISNDKYILTGWIYHKI